jgi:hypothetical protein
MKKNVVVILTGALILTAASTVSANDHCVAAVPLPQLWVDTGRLEFKDFNNTHKPICVHAGGTFQIWVRQPGNPDHEVEIDDIEVTPKDSDGPDISGSNDEAWNIVTVTVESTAVLGETYGYFIKVKGVGILDPRVQIIETDSIEREAWDELDQYLREQTGMTLEQIQGITRVK